MGVLAKLFEGLKICWTKENGRCFKCYLMTVVFTTFLMLLGNPAHTQMLRHFSSTADALYCLPTRRQLNSFVYFTL